MMRNPSPPPLTELKKSVTDRIGDTLFSKKWVLEILLKLYKHEIGEIYLQEKVERKDNEDNNSPLELLEKIEKDVCDLWDMSMNHDIANFLFANEVVDILMDVMEKTSSPRLMEMCLGILGNMVCVDDICLSCSSNVNFRQNMLSYLSVSDAPSLVELTRMLLVCLNNGECYQKWLQNFQKHSNEMLYILQNTMNIVLLEHVLELLDILFDASDDIIDCYAGKQFIEAVVESYAILRKEKKGALVTTLLHAIQSVSTTKAGVISLSNSVDLIMNFLYDCVKDQKKETFIIENIHPFYSAVYSILNCILAITPCDVIKYINEEVHLIETLMDLLTSITEDENMYDYLTPYLEFMQNFAHAAVQVNADDVTNVVNCLRNNKTKWTKLLDSLKGLKESPSTLVENINNKLNKIFVP